MLGFCWAIWWLVAPKSDRVRVRHTRPCGGLLFWMIVFASFHKFSRNQFPTNTVYSYYVMNEITSRTIHRKCRTTPIMIDSPYILLLHGERTYVARRQRVKLTCRWFKASVPTNNPSMSKTPSVHVCPSAIYQQRAGRPKDHE